MPHFMRFSGIATVALLAWSSGQAAALHALITDRDRAPMADTVLMLVPTDASRDAAAAPQAAPEVMDQVKLQFNPQVMVVGKGGQVAFPNSDTVAHQVYSFSTPKRFSLGLYRGLPYAPVVFDQPGLVVLGCNIHDFMLGYVYVAESPYFGKSNERGEVHVADIPAGTYALKAWGPRFKEQEAQVLQQVTLRGDETLDVTLKLDRMLSPLRNPAAKPGKLRY
jgi:plastocyanin